MRLLISGESHGKGYLGILEGLPAGLLIDEPEIAKEMKRRKFSPGRSERQKIEEDKVQLMTGVLEGKTTGGAVGILIENVLREKREMKIPRPGHIDLAGFLKYADLEGMLLAAERASARETAVRVAAGAILKQFLSHFGILIFGWTQAIGGIKAKIPQKINEDLLNIISASRLYCPDQKAESLMLKAIKAAGDEGETLGGIICLAALGVPPGLGEIGQWDKRLDAVLAQAFMSIPSVKAVEIGAGFALTVLKGSKAQDEIFWEGKFYRQSNQAGGIEGGLSNGAPILVRAGMKPIPTLKKGLQSVDPQSKKAARSPFYRSDVCVVPAGVVIGEAMLSLVLADALLAKFGGDSLELTKMNWANFREHLSSL